MSAPLQRAHRRPPEWHLLCGDPASELFGGVIGQQGYYFARQPDGSFICQKQGPGGAYPAESRYTVRVLPPASCTCKGWKIHGRCKHLSALRAALGLVPGEKEGVAS